MGFTFCGFLLKNQSWILMSWSENYRHLPNNWILKSCFSNCLRSKKNYCCHRNMLISKNCHQSSWNQRNCLDYLNCCLHCKKNGCSLNWRIRYICGSKRYLRKFLRSVN
jgi:hypothetical protein